MTFGALGGFLRTPKNPPGYVPAGQKYNCPLLHRAAINIMVCHIPSGDHNNFRLCKMIPKKQDSKANAHLQLPFIGIASYGTRAPSASNSFLSFHFRAAQSLIAACV